MSLEASFFQTFDDYPFDSVDTSYLLQRVKRASCGHCKSSRSFESTCVDAVTLWSTLDSEKLGVDTGKALASLWSAFLSQGVAYVTSGTSLSCIRALLEAVVVSSSFPYNSTTTTESAALISTANNSCVDNIIRALISNIHQQTISLSSLIPPVGLLQQLTSLIELLQEYCLTGSDETSSISSAVVKLVEAYDTLLGRYTTLFVEEVTFPSYWNINWKASSTCLLIYGVHPSVYFCFTSLVNLVQGCRRRSYVIDNRPCRQIVARVLEKGALAILLVVEENELSDMRKRQIQRDTLHFVLFARMFRGFVGQQLFSNVLSALVCLLEAVAKCVKLGVTTTVTTPLSSFVCVEFENKIWNVPPIEASEWEQFTGVKGNITEKRTNVFTPWSGDFIRASYVKVAQMPPDGWEHFPFRQLV